MKPAETFIYVGGALGMVGGYDEDRRKTFVRQSDYMTLQDDVARLTLLYTKALNEVAVKEAEVERLRKAGDELIVALDKRDDYFDNSDKRQAIADWNAAKEGKQS